MPKKDDTVKITGMIPGKLDMAIGQEMKRRGLRKSEALREALAAWCGDPSLAEMPATWGRYSEDPSRRTKGIG